MTKKTRLGSEDANDRNRSTPTPLLGDAKVVGMFFRDTYGTEGWTELVEDDPQYSSGPLPKAQGGLAARRLADPEARFHYSVMMSAAALLPFCVAHDAAEKDRLTTEIGQILGLDVAVAAEMIAGWLVCWRQGRFPKSPTAVRIRTAPGRRSRAQVLGQFEREIVRFVNGMLAQSTDTGPVGDGRQAESVRRRER